MTISRALRRRVLLTFPVNLSLMCGIGNITLPKPIDYTKLIDHKTIVPISVYNIIKAYP